MQIQISSAGILEGNLENSQQKVNHDRRHFYKTPLNLLSFSRQKVNHDRRYNYFEYPLSRPNGQFCDLAKRFSLTNQPVAPTQKVNHDRCLKKGF